MQSFRLALNPPFPLTLRCRFADGILDDIEKNSHFPVPDGLTAKKGGEGNIPCAPEVIRTSASLLEGSTLNPEP